MLWMSRSFSCLLLLVAACGDSADDLEVPRATDPRALEPLPATCDRAPSPVGACQTHRDCDGDPANGCETPKGTVDDCGACGISCAEGDVCHGGRICGPPTVGEMATEDQYPFATQIEGGCVLHGSGAVQCLTLNPQNGTTFMGVLWKAEQITDDRPCVVYETGSAACLGSASAEVATTPDGVAFDDVARIGHECLQRDDGTVHCVPGTGLGRSAGWASGFASFYRLDGVDGEVVGIEPGGFSDYLLRADGTVVGLGSDIVAAGESVTAPHAAELPCVEDAVQVAGGGCVLHADGGVSCAWEDRLPVGATEGELVVVEGLSDVLFIDSAWHTDGGWRGDGVAARLRDGSVVVATPKDTLIPYPGLEGAVDLMSDQDSLCGLMPDGSVQCFAVSDQAAWSFPLEDPCVADPGSCAELTPEWDSVNGTHCAVTVGGHVRCWGDVVWGLLGDVDTPEVHGSASLPLPAPAVEVGVGGHHACARLDTDEVWCWGTNDHGQLGAVALDVEHLPTRVFTDAIGMSVGGQETCVVKIDQTVWCVGEGDEVPHAIQGVAGAVQVSVSGDGSELGEHALLADGTVMAWDTTAAPGEVPSPWCGLTGVDELAGGQGVTCVRQGASWSCAGANTHAVITLPESDEVVCPIPLLGLDDATWLTPGDSAICGGWPDGSHACVGGTYYAAMRPPQELGPVWSIRFDNPNAAPVACALKEASRSAWCWNDIGELRFE